MHFLTVSSAFLGINEENDSITFTGMGNGTQNKWRTKEN